DCRCPGAHGSECPLWVISGHSTRPVGHVCAQSGPHDESVLPIADMVITRHLVDHAGCVVSISSTGRGGRQRNSVNLILSGVTSMMVKPFFSVGLSASPSRFQMPMAL